MCVYLVFYTQYVSSGAHIPYYIRNILKVIECALEDVEEIMKENRPFIDKYQAMTELIVKPATKFLEENQWMI